MSSVKKSKGRSLLIGFIWIVCLSCIMCRLLFIQTVNSDKLLAEANKNWLLDQTLRPKRGAIYDRTREQLLAWETDAYVFVADTRHVKDKRQTAKLLSPLLGIPEGVLYGKLAQNKVSVELRDKGRYKFPKEVYDKLRELHDKDKLEGIYSYRTVQRRYKGPEATHVLGFLNQDDQAVGGVETTYDRWLRGKKGRIKYIKARDGMMISDEPQAYHPPIEGKDVVLTLDWQMQHQVEKELDLAMNTYEAKGAMAVVADPKTGEILAMASRPNYDPNQYAKTYTDEGGINRIIGYQFEPGSTFKIVTLAAAIEENVFKPEEKFHSGSIRVEDRTIRDWKAGGWGDITYRQGVGLSSNVAFVLLGQKLGEEKLIHYINQFGFGNVTAGFGKKTGIDLPNEQRGVFFRDSLYPSELASISFGQGISVTPIQQVAAVSAIANGGIWYKPRIVREIWDPNLNKVIRSFHPEGHRIVQPQTAKNVSQLLRDVVTNGLGNGADVPGFRVAGKTGTAQKPNPKGGYYRDRHIVSFVGFAPYDKAELVVYVALDEPSTEYGSVSGGRIAAPIAREIFRKALQIRQIKERRLIAEDIK